LRNFQFTVGSAVLFSINIEKIKIIASIVEFFVCERVCVCTCFISYLCKINCEIGVAGFFEMPPKAKPLIIDADLFYGVVGDCLTDFFKNHTTQCSCEQVILNLNDELNNCKSLIVAQTALINQLYNAVIDLKFDLHKFQGPVMNQVGNSKFPPSGHLIFFSTNIRNENKTREIQKWPRARDRT
jgi:hypothetical protein